MSTPSFEAPGAYPLSPFSGTLICAAARLPTPPGICGPVFDQDVWDLCCVQGLPAYLPAHRKRPDFTAIKNPVFRLAAKEYALALLAPGHELVRVLPLAHRAARSVNTVALKCGELTRWFNWLTGHGVTHLDQVTEEHCARFVAERCVARDAAGRRIGEQLDTGAAAAREVIGLGLYADLLSVGGYREGLRPFDGRDALAAVGLKKTLGENKTPVVAPEVLGPSLAAALYIALTLGPHIVALDREFQHAKLDKNTRLPAPRPEHTEAVTTAVARRVADAVSFDRLAAGQAAMRVARHGFADDDPLLHVSFTRIARELGVRDFPLSWVRRLRPQLEDAVRRVGIEEPYARAAPEVARADDGTPVRWTAPLDKYQAQLLPNLLRTACTVIVAGVAGMRNSEIAELRAGCRTPPEITGPGRARYRIAGTVVKDQPLGGTADDWVVTEPVYRALEIAEGLTTVPGGLLRNVLAGFNIRFEELRSWVETTGHPRFGLARIPPGAVNPRMLRRSLARELAYRPGGLLAAKIHLKHISIVTTEGYAARPGGAQGKFLAEVAEAQEERNVELVVEQYRNAADGRLPSGPGARDLIAFFGDVGATLGDAASTHPNVIFHDGEVHAMIRKRAQTLHLGTANYCWFADPAKALCLRLAGTPAAQRPLLGMCDAARCPQATFDSSHRTVWAETAAHTTVFLGQISRGQKAERTRLQVDLERAERVVALIDAAQAQDGSGAQSGQG